MHLLRRNLLINLVVILFHVIFNVTVSLLVRNIVAAVVLFVVGAATEISALQSSLPTLASVVGKAILLTAAFH